MRYESVIPQCRCSTLESTSKYGKQRTDLDGHLAPKGLSRPDDKQSADGATGTEDTISRGYSWSRLARVARLARYRKVKVRVPSWLTDGASDNGGTISVSLHEC